MKTYSSPKCCSGKLLKLQTVASFREFFQQLQKLLDRVLKNGFLTVMRDRHNNENTVTDLD